MLSDILMIGDAVLMRRLPPFVYGAPGLSGPPVFIYHKVDPERFESDLRYLTANGYVFLDDMHLVAVMRGERPFTGREVALTFDDGFDDLLSTVEPLLRSYGAVATAFIVPGLIGHPGYLSWEELSRLSASGTVSIGTHSYRHAKVFISGILERFYLPADIREETVVLCNGHDTLLSLDGRCGRPLYRSSSRLSDSPRYREDEKLTAMCTKLAAETAAVPGSEAWMQELYACHRAYTKRYGDGGRLETLPEQERAIYDELVRARDVLEKKLGRRVTSLCLPWNEGGKLVRRLCRQAGYEACLAGYADDNRSNSPGADPYVTCRLSGDFVRALPGKGRAGLVSILAGKAGRRMGYHEL